MLPIQLKIEGLYSYKEEQEINFKELSKTFIFGIFGNVGSGKSAILDAIIFVLYKQYRITGMTVQDIINKDSQAVFVEFVFKVRDKEYKFRRTANRKSTQISLDMYIKKDDAWDPLDKNEYKAEGIIGLDYSSFSRSIIIPQDKFADFLRLTAKKRSEMMKKMYPLEKIELYDKTKALKDENTNELKFVRGQLLHLEKINIDFIKTLTKVFQETTHKLQEKNKDLKGKKEAFEKFKKDHEQFEKLATLKAKRDAFLLLQDDINSIRLQLQNHQNIQENFASLHLSINTLQEETKALSNQKRIAINKQAAEQHSLYQLQERQEKIEDLLEEKEEKFLLVEQLKILLNVRKLSAQKVDAQKKHDQHVAQSEEEQKNIQTHKNNQTFLQTEIDRLGSTDTHLIQQSAKLKQLNNTLRQNKEKETDCKQNLEQVINNIKINLHQKVVELGIPMTHKKLGKNISESIQVFEKKIEGLDQEIKKLDVKKQLCQYSIDLKKKGGECPICGATEHPNLQEQEQVGEQLKNALKQQKQSRDICNFLKECYLQIDKSTARYKDLKTNLDAIQKEIQAIEDQIKIIKNTGLDLEKANSLLEENTTNERQRKDKEKLKKEVQEKLQILESSAKVLLQKETSSREALIKINTLIENDRKEIKEATAQTYNDQPILEIKELIKSTSEKYKDVEAESKEIQSKMVLIEKKYQQFVNETDGLDMLLKSKNKTLTQNLEEWSQKLEEMDLAQSYVEEILIQKIEKEALHKKVTDYDQEVALLGRSIEDLTTELKDAPHFDKQQYEDLKDAIFQIEKEREVLIEQKGATQTSLKTSEDELELKSKLLAQKASLDQRNEYLTELFNLFSGGKFVNYVSSIFISELLRNANTKFKQFSNSQLKLCFSTKELFEVEDIDGSRRKIHTLSGGQTFQVALAFALAFSDQVNQGHKGPKFFFIDEGFGTQDKVSLQKIIYTLQTLANKNHIIGLISHVEELKEEISPYLMIQRDANGCSTIKKSWEV